MALTEHEFLELHNGGAETRSVEFKPAGARTDVLLFAHVAKAVLAMTNLSLGGWVIVGVQADGTLGGLLEVDVESWLEFDAVSAGLNAYADPFVKIDIHRVMHDAKLFVVIRVHEFEEVPVLARKDSPPKADGKLVIRRGACYVRPRFGPASVEVPSQTEMRELLDAAVDKALARFLTRAGRAGMLASAVPPPSDEELFEKQLGDFR